MNASRPDARKGRLLGEIRALVPELRREAIVRDQERRMAFAEVELLRRAGLPGAIVPASHGGPEVPLSELAEIFCLLGQADPSIAQAFQPHFCVVEWLRLDATPTQQRDWFAGLLEGDIYANAFAERGGRFIGDIRTTLTPDGNRFRLNGRKFYSTGSAFADRLYVTALDPKGGRILACFPKNREGVTVEDDWDSMGQRTTASGTTLLDNVPILADEVIVQGDWGERRTHLGALAQIMHAAIDVGIALAALDDAAEYGRTKARPMPESGVERAADDPYILHSVGEMAVAAHGAEAMLRRAGEFLDAAQQAYYAKAADAEERLAAASIAVAESKAAGQQASLFVGERLFSVGGASSTFRTLDLDRHWRNARTHTTHDPVAYKYKAVGDYWMNGRYPPITTKI